MPEGSNSNQDHGAKRRSEGHRGATADSSAIARAFGLSIELVAATLVCAAIGWLIDRCFKTFPWGMLLLLLFGFAAGVLNVMRRAGVFPRNRFH